MNKEDFIKYMREIRKIVNQERKLDKAFKEFDSDFGGFTLGNCVPLMLDILATAMNDTSEWISYYVYETEFATNSCADSVTDENGNKIPFKTYSDLYDMIMSEKEPDELEKYRLLYENEKDHTDTLQRLVDKIIDKVGADTIKSELNNYFDSEETNTNDYFDKFLNTLTNELLKEFGKVIDK